MSTLPAAPRPTHAAAASRFLHWQVQAWRWWRRAPLVLPAMAFLPILVELAVQLGIPHWGVPLSKLVTPMAGSIALIALHARMQHGRLRLSRAVAQAWRLRGSVLAIALLMVATFGVQLLACLAIAGPDSALALLHGDGAHLRMSRAQLGLAMAAGVPVTTALLFVTPLALLRGHPFGRALREGLAAALRHRRPVLILCATLSALLFAMVFMPLLLLAMLPYATAVSYAAYRDVCDGVHA